MFFNLHHYCNLNKNDIFSYTLPQISLLMNKVNKHIQFEIDVQFKANNIFGGGEDNKESTDDDYEEIDEEGIGLLSSLLSG